MNPQITIIVPIYNTIKYLDDCLYSIRKQTFKNIEIICIDDCSPDDSYLIVEKHIIEDPRIRLIRNENNKGLGGARNAGILAAKSEFIASVDSDDTIKENMLEALWNANNDTIDIVCCGYDELTENGIILHSRNFKKANIVNSENNIDIFNVFNPSFCNKLWRRSLFVDNSIFFPENSVFEDTSTTPRLLMHAKKIKVIDKSYYNYYQRSQSITSVFSINHITDLFKAYDIVLESLIKNNALNHYKEKFVEYIESGVRFHSQCISSSNIAQDKIDQYLQKLSDDKESFLENKLTIFRKGSKNITIPQRLGSKIFEILFGFFISPTYLKKLKHHPEYFFKDSNNKFTRFIGSILKLI